MNAFQSLGAARLRVQLCSDLLLHGIKRHNGEKAEARVAQHPTIPSFSSLPRDDLQHIATVGSVFHQYRYWTHKSSIPVEPQITDILGV
jgi:hypothetical protein